MPTPRYRGGRPRKHPDGVRTSIHGSGRPPGSARGRPRVEEHGNRTMYTNGCRCDSCRKANSDYHRALRNGDIPRSEHRPPRGGIRPNGTRSVGPGLTRPPSTIRTPKLGDLLTPCWCERYHDYLPAIDITQGRTWTCGAPNCKPTGDAA
jgi:hypothetical protein